jgi:hypothetical protein
MQKLTPVGPQVIVPNWTVEGTWMLWDENTLDILCLHRLRLGNHFSRLCYAFGLDCYLYLAQASEWVTPVKFRFRGRVHSVIVSFCARTVTYGHAIFDWLMPLFAYPGDVIRNSYLLCMVNPNTTYLQEGLSWFGLNRRLMILQKSQYIEADLCYTSAVPVDFYGGCAIRRIDILLDSRILAGNWRIPVLVGLLRSFMVKRANLDLAKPVKYGFLQRAVRRRIENLEEIRDLARREFPMIDWKMLLSATLISQNARFFNRVRFFFGAHGAAFANAVFMQPKTVLCEVQCDRPYPDFMGISQILGLFHIVSRGPGMIHQVDTATILPLKLAHDMIKAGLSALNFGRRPIHLVY